MYIAIVIIAIDISGSITDKEIQNIMKVDFLKKKLKIHYLTTFIGRMISQYGDN